MYSNLTYEEIEAGVYPDTEDYAGQTEFDEYCDAMDERTENYKEK